MTMLDFLSCQIGESALGLDIHRPQHFWCKMDVMLMTISYQITLIYLARLDVYNNVQFPMSHQQELNMMCNQSVLYAFYINLLSLG